MIYLVLFELLLAVHLASSFTNNDDLQILTNCAGTVDRNGHIKSPNYPSNYGDNENCYWLVSSNTENIVMLFESFHTESSYDFLKVMDVNNNLAEIGSYNGIITSNSLTTFSTNQMNITFTTDGSNTHQGFSLKIHLDIQVQTNCAGTLYQNGSITSPNYPSNYANNEDCYWDILSKKNIYLNVESFITESGYDYLELLDVNNNLAQIGKYAGNLVKNIVSSLSNHIKIKFTSDHIVNYRGFSLNYQLRLGTQVHYNCPGTVERNGRISSPNYPRTYGNNEDCHWILSSHTGHIRLKFDTFETESSQDFLRVYDMNSNSALIGSYDGALINNDVKTFSTNHIKIIFTSDGSGTKHGFSFKYNLDLMPKVSCSPDQMEIELKHYLIPNVNWQNLHLNDPQCKATYINWGSVITLLTIVGKCGSKVIQHQDKITYHNKVLIDNSNSSDVITTESTAAQFQCEYNRRQNVGTSYNATKEIVMATEVGFGSFTFEMHLFKSIKYNNKYLPQDYPVAVTLGERIWLQYQVINTAKDLVVFAENCHATTSTDSNSVPQHPLLVNGCPKDTSMIYRYQPNTVQQFSINAFRFTSSQSSLVFLHCELLVCHRNSNASRCSQGCASSRRRRSDEKLEGSSKKYSLSTGPLFSKRDDAGGNQKQSGLSDGVQSTNIVLIAMGAFIVVAIGAAVLILWRIKKRNTMVVPAPTVNAHEGPAIISLNGFSKSIEAEA